MSRPVVLKVSGNPLFTRTVASGAADSFAEEGVDVLGGNRGVGMITPRLVKPLDRVVASEAVIEAGPVHDAASLHDVQSFHHRDTFIAADRSPTLRVRIVLQPDLKFPAAPDPGL